MIQDNFIYDYYQDGVSIIGIVDRVEVLVVPHVLRGRMVRRIENEAFSDNTTLQCVVLPDTLSSIGRNAFAFCTNLKYIHMPDSIVDIEHGALSHCKALEYVVLPNSLIAISSKMFYCCSSLRYIHFYKYNKLQYRGDYAIWGCDKLHTASVEALSALPSRCIADA